MKTHKLDNKKLPTYVLNKIVGASGGGAGDGAEPQQRSVTALVFEPEKPTIKVGG